MVPIAAPVSHGSLVPVYYSQIYVRSDSCYFDITQLQNSIFAFNDESSLSGYHCMNFFLKALSESETHSVTLPFFRGAVRTGAHVMSLRFLVDRRADAAVVDCKVVDELMESSCGRELLSLCRPIYVPSCAMTVQQFSASHLNSITVSECGKLGPYPSQPIVVSKRLDTIQIELIKKAFLSCSASSLAPLRSIRFVEVDDAFYRNITVMIDECSNTGILCDNEVKLPKFSCVLTEPH